MVSACWVQVTHFVSLAPVIMVLQLYSQSVVFRFPDRCIPLSVRHSCHDSHLLALEPLPFSTEFVPFLGGIEALK